MHINQLAQQLQVSPELVRSTCNLLGLPLKPNDTVDETVERQLVQLKEVAEREGISLEEAARHLVEMRDRKLETETGAHKFDKREYIKQRFGIDPEIAAPDSFVGMLYHDADRGVQLGQLRHKVVLETSTLALEEFVFNGSSNIDNSDYNSAQERIQSRIDNDFFAKVNWGEGSHPLLVSSSTHSQKQLKLSQPKTGQSQKK
ncbi:hypothetical protein NIES4071_14010 [Calothrix sp. NIES-4071]|nr:hypothetical protein NIES4071_14010 [Calothrix sp. NIES-4071]BAZ55739.1 hypothetical protein NIES4105_13960 [Calothrix sp. NIES-4105]